MRRAAIVAPIRTAVGKFQGALAPMTAGELGAVILKALVERTEDRPRRRRRRHLRPGLRLGEAPCIARWAALAADFPIETPGYQLDRRCGSGLQAVIDAAMMVQTGAADVVVAGGVESMSNVEYYTPRHAQRRPRRLGHPARSPGARAGDEPADQPLRRHLRHDRDRRQPRPRLPDQPRGLRRIRRHEPPAGRRGLGRRQVRRRDRAGHRAAEARRSGRLRPRRGRARRRHAREPWQAPARSRRTASSPPATPASRTTPPPPAWSWPKTSWTSSASSPWAGSSAGRRPAASPRAWASARCRR